jgi:hypothetical protein
MHKGGINDDWSGGLWKGNIIHNYFWTYFDKLGKNNKSLLLRNSNICVAHLYNTIYEYYIK